MVKQPAIRSSRDFGPMPRWVAAVAVLVALAAGCGSDDVGGEVATPSDIGTTTAETTPGSEPTEAATSFENDQAEAPDLVATAGGGQIDWNSLQGQDVVLWFWAPW